jgi:hypothetical protein
VVAWPFGSTSFSRRSRRRRAPAGLVVGLVGVAALLVATLFVRLEESLERVDGAGCGELGELPCSGDREGDRGGLVLRVGHLAGDRALPDQVVHALLVAIELARD